jgi:hypothetical protein
MIFRLTQRVAAKLRIGCSPAITGSYPWMMEWYCNLLIVRRRQFYLFTHGSSLFSFWAVAARPSREDFGAMFRRCAVDTLNDYGFSDTESAEVIDDGPDVFARAADRSVLGSMVDYGKMLRYAVDDEGGLDRLTPRARNDLANECPMSKIGMATPVQYLRQLLHAETSH